MISGVIAVNACNLLPYPPGPRMGVGDEPCRPVARLESLRLVMVRVDKDVSFREDELDVVGDRFDARQAACGIGQVEVGQPARLPAENREGKADPRLPHRPGDVKGKGHLLLHVAQRAQGEVRAVADPGGVQVVVRASREAEHELADAAVMADPQQIQRRCGVPVHVLPEDRPAALRGLPRRGKGRAQAHDLAVVEGNLEGALQRQGLLEDHPRALGLPAQHLEAVRVEVAHSAQKPHRCIPYAPLGGPVGAVLEPRVQHGKRALHILPAALAPLFADLVGGAAALDGFQTDCVLHIRRKNPINGLHSASSADISIIP